MTDELPIIPFESEQAWQQWLDDQHETAPGLWLKIAKKDAGIESLSYQEALTVALCFGWIDGQKKKFDDRYWLQRFTPRRPKSNWSQINRDKATTLIEQGLMREAGLREVERARQDGRWDAAYAPQSKVTMPDDFQQALDQNPAAQAFFEQLNSANRFAILSQIHDAKKPETRQRRMTKYLDMLKRKEKLYD
jgi:uncharacterized protein YdeI (YjbR/CyaY-like superfamily)